MTVSNIKFRPDYVLQNFLALTVLIDSISLQQQTISKLTNILTCTQNIQAYHLIVRPFGGLLTNNPHNWRHVMLLQKPCLKNFLAEVRYEAYRNIILKELESNPEILNFALEDFRFCKKERHLEYVIPTLFN